MKLIDILDEVSRKDTATPVNQPNVELPAKPVHNRPTPPVGR